MRARPKRIVLAVLTIVIGLPVVFVAAVLAWGWISDQTNGTIVSSGVTRRYLLYVPNAYDRSKPTPLVTSFHPGATWPAVEMSISRWNDVADEHGFIVVYSEGTGFLLGGLGPGPQIWDTLGRDVLFISDLIDKLEAEYNIDPNRIYANGMSNGGGMVVQTSGSVRGGGSGGGRSRGALELWGFQAGADHSVSRHGRQTRPLPRRAVSDRSHTVCEYS
jgi:poly(3-hydroxybutyrate) depolymerase